MIILELCLSIEKFKNIMLCVRIMCKYKSFYVSSFIEEFLWWGIEVLCE